MTPFLILAALATPLLLLGVPCLILARRAVVRGSR